MADEHADDLAKLRAEAMRVGEIRDAAMNLAGAVGHLRAVLSTPSLSGDPSYLAGAWENVTRRRAEWRAIVLGQVDLEKAREDVALPWFRESRRARYRAALDRLEELSG